MNKESIIKAFNKTKYKIGKHAPEILIGIGITEMAMTVVLAVKATPKAVTLIDEAQAKKREETIEYNCQQNKVADCVSVELTPLETIKVAWKPYIPAAITGAVAVACIIGSNSINSKRNAAIATAYKISEAALNDYKAKVVESIGEKKEQLIQEKVTQDKIDSNPPTNTTVIMAGNGDQLFYDGVSGRYFNSTIEKVDAAINTINRTMTYEMYVSLSEFYDELGLEHTDVSDELGWNLDNGLVEVEKGAKITVDGRSCITLDYYVAPRYDFSKLN